MLSLHAPPEKIHVSLSKLVPCPPKRTSSESAESHSIDAFERAEGQVVEEQELGATASDVTRAVVGVSSDHPGYPGIVCPASCAPD